MPPDKGSTDLNWWSEYLLPWTLRFGRSLLVVLATFLVILLSGLMRGTWWNMAGLAFGRGGPAAQQMVLRREIVPPVLFACYAWGLVGLVAVFDLARFLRAANRPDRLRNRLRFDGFLLVKSAVALGSLMGVWLILRDPAGQAVRERPSGESLVAWFWLFGLAAVGLVYWSLLDQRYRCRVCLRRLRMPVPTGSWSTPLLDRPGTEYICPFGHGKVNVASVRMFGMEPAHWTYYRDFWQELVEQEHAAHEE